MKTLQRPIAALLCILPSLVLATPVNLHMSLHEAILLGVRMNLAIRSAELQRVTDKFSLAEAHNQFVPQYSLAGTSSMTNAVSNSGPHSLSWASTLTPKATLDTALGTGFTLSMDNTYTNRDDATDSYNPAVTLKVTQPLMRGFGKKIVLAALNKAEATELNNRLSFKNTIISQVNTIITDYLSLIKDKRNLVIQQQAVSKDQDNLNAFKAKIKAGVSAPSDLSDIQTTLFQDKLALVSAKNTEDSDRQKLLTDLGLDPNAKISIDDTLDLTHYQIPTLLKSQHVAKSHNISYQQALITLGINEISLAQAEDDGRWKLDLSAQSTYGGGASDGRNAGLRSLTNGSNTEEQVALTLDIPIDNFSIKQAIANARITVGKQQISVKQSRWSLQTQVINSLRQLNSDREQIKLAKRRLVYAKKSYEAIKKKVSVGRSTTFELTSKASDLTQANLTLVSNEIGFMTDFANFDALLGTTLQTWQLNIAI
ncbi:MAG: transporter [marine bacterium B5-7]|nr:MAG: transporter [marine bacterium B5-7]